MLQINYQNQTHYEMDEYVEVFKKIAKHTLKKFSHLYKEKVHILDVNSSSFVLQLAI